MNTKATQNLEDPTAFLGGTTQPLVEGFDPASDQDPNDRARRQVERQFRHDMAILVKQLRHELDCTQACAADAWGSTQNNVSRFEKDPGNARAATLMSYLSQALGAEVSLVITTDDSVYSVTMD